MKVWQLYEKIINERSKKQGRNNRLDIAMNGNEAADIMNYEWSSHISKLLIIFGVIISPGIIVRTFLFAIGIRHLKEVRVKALGFRWGFVQSFGIGLFWYVFFPLLTLGPLFVSWFVDSDTIALGIFYWLVILLLFIESAAVWKMNRKYTQRNVVIVGLLSNGISVSTLALIKYLTN